MREGMATWIAKILIALGMALFLLHVPATPTASPNVQIVTITIGHDHAALDH